jgi:hypothetical protein
MIEAIRKPRGQTSQTYAAREYGSSLIRISPFIEADQE